MFGPGWVRGGSAAAPSLIEIQAAVDEARERVAEAAGRGERARFAMAVAARPGGRGVRRRRGRPRPAARLRREDVGASPRSSAPLGVAVRSARSEAERTERAIAAAEAALDSDRTEHAGLAERYEAAGVQPDDTEPTSHRRARPARRRRAAARAHETELRLALRTREERGRALHDRATALEAAAVAEIERPGPARGPAAAPPARGGGGRGGPRGRRLRRRVVTRAAERADALRRRAEEARTARDAELGVLRRDVASSRTSCAS